MKRYIGRQLDSLVNSLKMKIHNLALTLSPDQVLLTDGLTTGRGVIALKDFWFGDTVLEFKGALLTLDQLPATTHEEYNYYLQIGPNLYIGPSGEVDDYVNHSCRPNCIIHVQNNRAFLVSSIRRIKRGEELTFDYASTMYNDPWTMECKCGYPECRQIIKSPNL